MPVRKVSVLILYNDDGELLLQHRTKDAPTLPDYWAFFGGGIEGSESAEGAVRREALEELGYQVTSPRLFTVDQVSHEGTEIVLHVFVERYDGSPLTLGEGQGMGWFLPAATKGLLVSEHDRSIIKAVGTALSAEIKS